MCIYVHTYVEDLTVLNFTDHTWFTLAWEANIPPGNSHNLIFCYGVVISVRALPG